MKELKMFPQITEETEENLLNLESDAKSPPFSTTPPSSSSSTDSPTDAPSSPSCENQGPCPLVTVTPEDVNHTTDIPVTNNSIEEECTTPPARVRMRSLSGGAYRIAPSLTTPTTGRMRRQSGDDVLTRVSPSRRAAFIEHFRPRSKSDSKSKRPTFLTNLKNSIFSPHRKTSLEADPPPLEPLMPGGDYRQRSRSGSETRGGTMSKMIDLFRSRSNSLSIDSKSKKPLNSLVPTNALLRRHSVDPDKRRRPFSTYRSLEAHQSESFSCHSEEDTVQRIDYENLSEETIIPTYLSSRTCYDAMPQSCKNATLSVDLLVKNAFEALVNNGFKAAPLWNSALSAFVGMLTISDFINVLIHHYRNNPGDIQVIEGQTIATWREITDTKPFVKINDTDNLARATKLLIEEGVHRVPVVQETVPENIIFLLSRKRLLKYLYQTLVEKFGTVVIKSPSYMHKSIEELGIGTFSDIATVTEDTQVIEALELFVQRRVSSLPIVDENNVCKDIFDKYNVFALAKEQMYHNLEMTIREAIHLGGVNVPAVPGKKEDKIEIPSCKPSDSLGIVIEKLVKQKAHRLIVTDERESVIGIVSLSDILKFLVLQPLEKMEESSNQASDTIEEAPEGAAGGADTDDSVFMEVKQKSPEDSASDPKESPVDEEEQSEDAKPEKKIVEECESEG